MNARDSILSAIAEAAGGPLPDAHRIVSPDPPGLRELFEERLVALGGRVVSWADLAALPGRKWCVDTSVGPLPPECGRFEPASAWEADIGMTQAAVGVAETGTILVQHRPSDRRLASLAPPHHVAILAEKDLVHTLDEAFDRLEPGNAVLVTGPSRTADIEGVLVRGVHGPRDLWVVVEKA